MLGFEDKDNHYGNRGRTARVCTDPKNHPRTATHTHTNTHADTHTRSPGTLSEAVNMAAHRLAQPLQLLSAGRVCVSETLMDPDL